jgi:esterase
MSNTDKIVEIQGIQTMQRHTFQNNDLTLSYLDSAGDKPILIALHAHWMEGCGFIPLASELASEWRVIALDQRGHGFSDHALTYARADYLSDLSALLTHLKITEPVVLLGNSLGGINAYHFAAAHPNLVRALVIEDIGAELDADATDVSFSLAWSGVFKSKEELEEHIGPRFMPYFKDSLRQTKNGWKLPFSPEEMLLSHENVMGDHWQEWLASNCPALIVRGKDSRVTSQEHLEEMARRRPNTQLETLEGGHVVHFDNLKEFTRTVNDFLRSLK